VIPNPAAEFSPFAITKSMALIADNPWQTVFHDSAARSSEDVAYEENPH